MLKQKLFIILGLCSLAILITINSFASNKKLLFIQTANYGTITKIKSHKNKYLIVLHQTQPFVIFFSERPNRITGIIPIRKFITYWNKGKQSFAADNPNAGLEAVTIDTMKQHKSVTFTFELSNPQYDPKTATLSYTAIPLAGNKQLPVFGKFGFTSLFIDDAQWMIGSMCAECVHY